MENETVTDPVETQEVTQSETPANEQSTELESQTEGSEAEGDEDRAEEGDEQDIEYTEVERDGKKYKLPKVFEEDLMLKADYTQKRQADAEAFRAWEAEVQRREQHYALRDQLKQDEAALFNIEQRINAYNNTNWALWYQQDPQGAGAAQAEWNQLRGHHENLSRQIQAKSHHIATQQEQETAIKLNEAQKALTQPRPDFAWDGKFDDGKKAAFRDLGQKLGLSPARLGNVTEPGEIMLFNLAKIGLEAVQKQRQAPRVQEAQPAARVPTSRTRGPVDPFKASMEQYAAARRDGRIK